MGKRKPESSILSIRLRKVDHDRLIEEAKQSGVPSSEYTFNLISRTCRIRKGIIGI